MSAHGFRKTGHNIVKRLIVVTLMSSETSAKVLISFDRFGMFCAVNDTTSQYCVADKIMDVTLRTEQRSVIKFCVGSGMTRTNICIHSFRSTHRLIPVQGV